MRACVAKAIDEIFSVVATPLYLSLRSHVPDRTMIPLVCPAEFIENPGEYYKHPAYIPDIDHGKTIKESGNHRHTHVIFQSPDVSTYNEVNTVHVEYYKPASQIPTDKGAILMSGLLGKSYGWVQGIARRLAEHRDVHALVLQMPYQRDRTPHGARSGELLHSGDLLRNLMGAHQTIADIRSIMNALETHGITKISVAGISHSATIAAMLTVVEPRLLHTILLMPIGDLGEFYSSGHRSARRIVDAITAASLSEIDVRKATALLSPARHKPAIPARDITVIAALYDQIIPVSFTHMLARGWNTNLLEYPEGHISIFLNARVKDDVVKLMGDS